MLKTKIVSSSSSGNFEDALDLLLGKIDGQASVQYRLRGDRFTALVVYETNEEGEENGRETEVS